VAAGAVISTGLSRIGSSNLPVRLLGLASRFVGFATTSATNVPETQSCEMAEIEQDVGYPFWAARWRGTLPSSYSFDSMTTSG